MGITDAFILNSNFFHAIIIIVLTGVLIFSFLNDKKNLLKTLWYLPLLLLIIMFASLDIYRNLVGSSTLVNIITSIIATTANIVFIFASIKNWKYLNKKLFFIIISIGVVIMILEILRRFNLLGNVPIYVAVITVIINTLFYFLIIQLIINASGKISRMGIK